MAIPTVVGSVGTANSGTTGAVTYTLPAHQADDILVLFCETNVSAGLTAPTNWAHVTGSPVAVGSNVTSVNVMWKRATSSSETNPQVAASTNHQGGFAMVFRGCITTGNPWDVTGTDSGTATTSVSFNPASSSTVADTLVVWALANNTDTATNQFSSLADSTLSSFTTQGQAFTTDGNGGGVAVATGGKAVAGSLGTLTGTIAASSSYAGLMFALKPPTVANVAAQEGAGSGSMTAPGVSTGPIFRVGTGTVFNDFDASSSMTAAYPTVDGGILANDLIVVQITVQAGSAPGPPAGSGWTAYQSSGATYSASTYVKYAAGGESGNLTITVPAGNGGATAAIDIYRGEDTTAAVDTSAAFGSDSGNTTISVGSLTTSVDNTKLVILVASAGVDPLLTAATVPATFYEVRDTTGTAPSLGVQELSWGGVGSTGSISLTQASADAYRGRILALKAARVVTTAPASTGSGSITAPGVSGGATIVVPAGAALGSRAAPEIVAGVTTPAMAASGAIAAPAVTAGVDTSAASSASGSITAPGVSAGAGVTAPAASATGSITAPTVALDVIVSVPAAGATGSITAPDAGGAAGVSAPAAGATGSAIVPALVNGHDLAAPAAVASGAVTPPVVSGGAALTVPAAGATGEMAPPVVNGGVAPNVEVEPPASTGSGSASAPTVTVSAVVAAPSAGSTASAGTPIIAVAAVVTVPTALAGTGNMAAPALAAGVNIVAPDASASGSIEHPLPQVAVTVLAAAGVATASAAAPALSVLANIQATAMLAHGSMGHPRILWDIRDITASATLDPRAWQAELVGRTWKATL